MSRSGRATITAAIAGAGIIAGSLTAWQPGAGDNAHAQPAARQQPIKGSDLELPREVALAVGRQVWRNETGAAYDAITAWNAGEDFPSLGIGHFIWFPAGVTSPFDESFPDMMLFLRSRGARLPRWLERKPFPPAPWNSRAQFRREFKSPRMIELRKFLHANFAGQAQFLVRRMQGALGRITASLPDPAQRAHVTRQFERVVAASSSLYPLVDYVSFKGEGVKDTEAFPNPRTGAREGWGLKQVLLAMRGTAPGQAALDEFSAATKAMMKRRVANRPSDKRWLAGWLNRCDTYRRLLR